MTHADELKSSGLKATLPRIKILEVFQNAQQRHMTAEGRVFGLVNDTHPSAAELCRDPVMRQRLSDHRSADATRARE